MGGWVINVWHNAQYLFFVWLFNTNRFRKGVEPKARFLSTISQPGNGWRYFGVCMALTTIIYVAIRLGGDTLLAIGIPSLIVVYQAINFHHYIVDALIWKARKAPMQKTLDLSKT